MTGNGVCWRVAAAGMVGRGGQARVTEVSGMSRSGRGRPHLPRRRCSADARPRRRGPVQRDVEGGEEGAMRETANWRH